MWNDLVGFARLNPVVAAALVSAASLFVGYVLAVLRQVLQAKAALAVERLRLRHQTASHWLAEFHEAAGRCWESIQSFHHPIVDTDNSGIDTMWERTEELSRHANRIYTIAGIVGLSCPSQAVGERLMEAATGFYNSVGRAAESVNGLQQERLERLKAELHDMKTDRPPVGGESAARKPGLVRLEADVIIDLWGAFVALCATVNAAAESGIATSRRAPSAANARRFLETLRTTHARGDASGCRSWLSRLLGWIRRQPGEARS